MGKGELLADYYRKNRKPNQSIADLARQANKDLNLGMNDDSVRRMMSHAINYYQVGDADLINYTITSTGNTSTEPVITEYIQFLPETGELDAGGNKRVKTLEELLEEAKVDKRIWTVDKHTISKSDTAKGTQNWQIKAWLTRDAEKENVINAAEIFEELLTEHDPHKYKPIKYSPSHEQNLLEINIFDLHLGKLCWSDEVNNNYDIKIASQRFQYALKTLLSRASSCQFERIVFPVGNDFFNSDNHLGTTTLGTRQDEDTRWQKTYKAGVQLLVEGIDYMRQFAPVDIIIVPGNHDFTKSFYLGETLSAWYHNDPNVKVNNSANARKYYEYGKVLLGFTHGDREKIEALRSLMAYEAKEAWARTTYKEFHLGHQHRKLSVKHAVKSDMLHEELGIVVRSMSSLAGTDAWHHNHGYVGPIRAAEAFLWNKEQGLIGNFNVNIKLNDN